jgi:hypothetical protein
MKEWRGERRGGGDREEIHQGRRRKEKKSQQCQGEGECQDRRSNVRGMVEEDKMSSPASTASPRIPYLHRPSNKSVDRIT